MRILVDMNLSPAWVDVLARSGIDAVHWSTVGSANASDRDIMMFARRHDCVVRTHDLDFSSILAATRGRKPSVIQLRATDVSPRAIGDSVVKALHQTRAHLESGALLTIDPKRARLRLLPLLS